MNDATKFLIFDTETSGLMDFKRPADDPGQPRVASVAMILLDHIDAEPRECGFLIKPDGWELSAEAAAVNGLTMAQLEAHGTPIAHALDLYEQAVLAGFVVVAHNAQFDCKMMRAEFRHAGRPDLFEQTRNVCTMRTATDIVRIPAKNGRGFKYPKLREAAEFFGIPHDDAHTSMGDARATLGILRHLHRLGALPEPKVYYAADGAPSRAGTDERNVA